MLFSNLKINHLRMIFIFNCLCFPWAIISLFGCNQASIKIPSDRASLNGDVTLLWNEIPNADSYNVYVSDSSGVTTLSGYKIPNVTNPVRINQLEPEKTYYFVVTVVNESGESKESKELSYSPIANKVGLIYWKNILDKSMQDHKSSTAETEQENNAASDEFITDLESLHLKNAALSDSITGDKTSSVDLAKIDLQSSKERVTETLNAQEDVAEIAKSADDAIETNSENNLLEMEEMRLKAAQALIESHLYIFFEPTSNELSPIAIEKLDQIYKILTNEAGAKLTLNGYSDSSGDSSINKMVSEARANSVKSYLSGKGINPSRMRAYGHGSQKSLVSNNSAEGRRLNRRVEIELIAP